MSTVAQAQNKVVVVPLDASAQSRLVKQTITIPDSAFSARSSSYQVTKVFQTGGAYVSGGSGSFVGITAPVQLPNQATVSSIVVYFVDNSLDSDLSLVLTRTNFTGSITTLAQQSTAGVSNTVRSQELINAPLVIDNTAGGYQLLVLQNNWISEGSDLRILGAKIEYEYLN